MLTNVQFGQVHLKYPLLHEESSRLTDICTTVLHTSAWNKFFKCINMYITITEILITKNKIIKKMVFLILVQWQLPQESEGPFTYCYHGFVANISQHSLLLGFYIPVCCLQTILNGYSTISACFALEILLHRPHLSKISYLVNGETLRVLCTSNTHATRGSYESQPNLNFTKKSYKRQVSRVLVTIFLKLTILYLCWTKNKIVGSLSLGCI